MIASKNSSRIADNVVRINTWNPNNFPSDMEFQYIDIASIDRDRKEIISATPISGSNAPSRARQLIQKDDVLVSTVRPNLNAVALVPESHTGAIASTGFCVLRCNPIKLCPRYLFHWVRTNVFVARMAEQSTGATYPAVTDGIIKNSELPVPSLPEQHRIANILDKADAIRGRRLQSMRIVDELLEASYLHFFGHPRRNPISDNVQNLASICEVNRGKFTPRPRNDPTFFGGAYPFIQTGEISASGGQLSRWTQTLNEKGIAISRRFDAGTVVIAIVGATIGETAILMREMYCPDSIIGIVPKSRMATSEYIEFTLRFYKQFFRDSAPETARANINLETLRPLKIPLPPLELQVHFSQLYQKCYSLKKLDALEESGRMFSSLIQRAFEGSL